VSTFLGEGLNQPADTIYDSHFMEIYEQAQRNIQQFHVAQQLRLVDRKNLLSGLYFYKHTPLDQDIKSKGLLTAKPFVFDDNDFLTGT